MIKVSDQAKLKAVQLMTEDGFDQHKIIFVLGEEWWMLWIGYVLNFDKEKHDIDQVFEDNGIKIIVDKKSFLYLVGTTLEYSGGLNGKGFIFNNPNASRTCGCGESFSL